VFTLMPVPYSIRDPMTMMLLPGKTGVFTSLLANGGVAYEVAPKIAVRGDVGLGALFFSSISQSRITGGREANGSLSMFHVRVAASADYAFTPNIIGTVMPIAFTYSPPKAGLNDTIKNITSIDFMVGIGYRM
jgi:hypothetical protein